MHAARILEKSNLQVTHTSRCRKLLRQSIPHYFPVRLAGSACTELLEKDTSRLKKMDRTMGRYGVTLCVQGPQSADSVKYLS